MAAFRYAQTVDLNNIKEQPIAQFNGHVGDALAHEWEVALTRNGTAEDLTGYSALAIHNRIGGATLEIIASISGNVVTVTFPQASYVYQGQGQAVLLRLTKAATGEETTVAGAQLNVYEGETGTPTDPSTTIPTLSELLAQIDAANDAAAAANDAADYATGIGAGLDARTGALETGKQDKAITDAGGYFTTDTVEAALQQVGGEIDALETTAGGHTTQLAEIGRFEATNLITHGSGWVGNACSLSLADNILALTVSDVQAYASMYRDSGEPVVGHKYYCAFTINPFRTHNPVANIGGVSSTSAISAQAGEYTRVSMVFDAAVSTDRPVVYCNGGITDEMDIGDVTRFQDDFMMLDLTAIFGAGHEPTAEQMDAYLAYWPNSYFEGAANLAAAGKALPALIEARKLLVEPEIITPTLVNGWTIFDAGVYGAVEYYKDAFGITRLSGLLGGTIATLGTAAFVLLDEDRPDKNLYFAVSASDGYGEVLINTAGEVVVAVGNKYWVSLNGISFKAGE